MFYFILIILSWLHTLFDLNSNWPIEFHLQLAADGTVMDSLEANTVFT